MKYSTVYCTTGLRRIDTFGNITEPVSASTYYKLLHKIRNMSWWVWRLEFHSITLVKREPTHGSLCFDEYLLQTADSITDKKTWSWEIDCTKWPTFQLDLYKEAEHSLRRRDGLWIRGPPHGRLGSVWWAAPTWPALITTTVTAIILPSGWWST